VVFHRCLPLSRNRGFPGSHLSYADRTVIHDQSAVKVHGVFPSRCGHPASSPEPQIRRAARQDSRSIGTPFVQVGTYPTRNFAHSVVTPPNCSGAGRTFLPPSACRHADRTLSSPAYAGVWLVVSEDSRKRSFEPFLLIACTQHIFTRMKTPRSMGYSDFPANSQI
jgi:hypothetical protein